MTKTDWAKFGRYADANRNLERSPDVVFLGNSITDHWARHRPGFFTSRNMAGRGISGQTSSHMLVRFRADVMSLKPKAVVILAGINDIALNNGSISLENIAGNIMSMCELARSAGIEPLICSVLPSKRIRWRPEVSPAGLIVRLNAMLRAYAADNGIDFVDYYSAMTDADGGLDGRYTTDGVHPLGAGYDVMEAIVLPHIDKYLTVEPLNSSDRP
ncbi:MAG: acylhydrolase [Muribaculaceae bacterium]|nr:acylhydrolase [Muribaculaceae bacterium]